MCARVLLYTCIVLGWNTKCDNNTYSHLWCNITYNEDDKNLWKIQFTFSTITLTVVSFYKVMLVDLSRKLSQSDNLCVQDLLRLRKFILFPLNSVKYLNIEIICHIVIKYLKILYWRFRQLIWHSINNDRFKQLNQLHQFHPSKIQRQIATTTLIPQVVSVSFKWAKHLYYLVTESITIIVNAKRRWCVSLLCALSLRQFLCVASWITRCHSCAESYLHLLNVRRDLCLSVRNWLQ